MTGILGRASFSQMRCLEGMVSRWAFSRGEHVSLELANPNPQLFSFWAV